VSRKELNELKQQIPLRDYLEALAWRPARRLSRGRWMGLCPLHNDHQPSFLMDPRQNLFYCYGCGRGGDVIRFAELYHQVQFPQALALLRQWRGLEPLLQETAGFYRMQLHRHGEAVAVQESQRRRVPGVLRHLHEQTEEQGHLRVALQQLHG
jgi:DNA primase